MSRKLIIMIAVVAIALLGIITITNLGSSDMEIGYYAAPPETSEWVLESAQSEAPISDEEEGFKGLGLMSLGAFVFFRLVVEVLTD